MFSYGTIQVQYFGIMVQYFDLVCSNLKFSILKDLCGHWVLIGLLELSQMLRYVQLFVLMF